ncbi:MAG: methylmalonyl-CoA mutase family protein [Leptospiraceae bacterium]|nr:methylmalonyl-CoA mutase family protein [Leptospiraceae bacterium]
MNHKIRILTAASLFDGHDASINIMRRVLYSHGAEVIHLGHNRSAQEIVKTAIEEDVHGIALTSYQGGHMEYFTYIRSLLDSNHAQNILLFGGGGGTILPIEIQELKEKNIATIFSPDDGRKMGLEGMIQFLLKKIDYSVLEIVSQFNSNHQAIARGISFIENEKDVPKEILNLVSTRTKNLIVLGITGTGGAGKSSFTDELVRNFSFLENEPKIAIISIDPTRKKSGGALLGDRIRMNSIYRPNIFMRSMATRENNSSTTPFLKNTIEFLKRADFDLILIETAGIGQSDSRISEFSDLSIYVMTPEFGASSQLEKIDMLDFADLVVINKSDRTGSKDALRDVSKQVQRNKKLFDKALDEMPVFGTISSEFNNTGIREVFQYILKLFQQNYKFEYSLKKEFDLDSMEKILILPDSRVRYLAEIVEKLDTIKNENEKLAEIAENAYHIQETIYLLEKENTLVSELKLKLEEFLAKIPKEYLDKIQNWEKIISNYKQEKFSYIVREKEILVDNFSNSLSNLKIPKVAVPRFKNWGEIIRFLSEENFAGEFPYTNGVFPFKRTGEEPTRMFAGEGGPERTNKRFHYLSKSQSATRLSTAFDSVTLYGEDPDNRPDIYGKIGNSGVSIATLDDAKRLYSGFRLTLPSTSVSMTINGPAPMLLAFFLNAAIDQECEIYIQENGLKSEILSKRNSILTDDKIGYKGSLPEGNYGLGTLLLGITGDEVLPIEVYERIKLDTLKKVRGTVQADILKEDQAQNTCIFSTQFALKLMGDVQEYFIQKEIRNFYSVSISGYHIAEAGANPITQVAFTLANGFTYLEYYLSRGMKIDSFAPNFSFFFSNGMDPEYSVIGRVARKIWAKAIRYIYNGNERSQMLKYHIQTSGRSLHAQEISFNDIRTTLQALYAIYDNCNSLHTNAYDEAITTPTEESVRRAVAIQLIVNKELGSAKTENFLQGSFAITELTDLVEEAIYSEFNRISERGGVLGAMETMYQRNKIQEESLYYENLKFSGELPIIGVNTFLDSMGSPTIVPREVIRATNEEKDLQVERVKEQQKRFSSESKTLIESIQKSAVRNNNIFETLMYCSKKLTLGEMSKALYSVGGGYRRSF